MHDTQSLDQLIQGYSTMLVIGGSNNLSITPPEVEPSGGPDGSQPGPNFSGPDGKGPAVPGTATVEVITLVPEKCDCDQGLMR